MSQENSLPICEYTINTTPVTVVQTQSIKIPDFLSFDIVNPSISAALDPQKFIIRASSQIDIVQTLLEETVFFYFLCDY